MTLEQLAAEGDAAEKEVDNLITYLVQARKRAKLIATIKKRKEGRKQNNTHQNHAKI